MEKNILVLFSERVKSELRNALAERRAEDPKADSAMLKFNVVEVFEGLGASRVAAHVRISKDYAWLQVEASQDGFYYPIDFAQRRQAKLDELEMMKGMENIPLTEAVCVAGIHKGEDEKFSMKWDQLITADGETLFYSGPVRKWHPELGENGEYDGPVAE